MTHKLFIGAFLSGLSLAAGAYGVAIPVTYQGTSWVADGVPIAIGTVPTNGSTAVQNLAVPRSPSQTFTTTDAFILDKIWINYVNYRPAASDFTINLLLFEVADPNAANMVIGTNLFSQPQTHTLPSSASNNAGSNYAIFDVENLLLKPNQGYAFMFSLTNAGTSGFPFQWRGTGGDVYAGGSYYKLDDNPDRLLNDQFFALQFAPPAPTLPPIDVATPEPSAIILSMIGMAALARRRGRTAPGDVR